MIEAKLFLGFPVDDDLDLLLKKINPQFKSFFIQNNSDYLQEMTFKNRLYLGKLVENRGSISDLELLENNIYSLLKKIVNDYPFEKKPLLLFPITLSND